MTGIEDRLRDAFRADAQTVQPQTVRPFASPATQLSRPAGDRPRGRLVIPVAAAAAVALVAVGTTVVLPRVLAPPIGIASGYPGDQMPSGPPPKFFLAITTNNDRYPSTTKLSVLNATTGRVTGVVSPPAAHRYFQNVAPLGNDRTFVADVQEPGCHTGLYTFRISAQGKPTGLTPLAVPVVPGQPQAGTLTASSDGTMIGFSTQVCSYKHMQKYFGQVGVINLASRHVTMWKYRASFFPVNLSLSANGALLTIVMSASRGLDLSIVRNAVWILRTSAPPGPLGQRYRKLIGPPTWPTATVLSPNGRLTWVLGWGQGPGVTLDTYQTATGELLRTWNIFSFQGYLEIPVLSLSASVSGRYLLVFGLTQVEKLDLATGKLTKVPGNNAYWPTDVAW